MARARNSGTLGGVTAMSSRPTSLIYQRQWTSRFTCSIHCFYSRYRHRYRYLSPLYRTYFMIISVEVERGLK